MSQFAPEVHDSLEKYKENRELSPSIIEELKNKMIKNIEYYSDLIFCPNKKCQSSVRVEIHKEYCDLFCPNCGWNKKVYKKD